MDVRSFFDMNGWQVVRDTVSPELAPNFKPYDDLHLSAASRQVLKQYPKGIYAHQKEALRRFLAGANICMTTSTASGKSLVFYLAAIEHLIKNHNGRVLAIYPLKALTDEQEQKWNIAGAQSGTGIKIGRIDGSVSDKKLRLKILRECSVVIMTPDVTHAWLLSNTAEPAVRAFLSNLRIIIVDEAHTYSGVFGSNSAYLYRRIHHLATKLKATPRYIAASATISNPQRHLKLLTGQDFDIVGQDLDSSGGKARRLLMVEAPPEKDILSSLTDLMKFIVAETDHQFVTFVDSRKQTEQLATVMRRHSDDDSEESSLGLDELERMQVLPFRAGYEAIDRKEIQSRLQNNQLRGVISTSALEMGIDIPWITMGVLVGIPASATSYYQRIGRVGRHAEGTIIVVRNQSLLASRVFRAPELIDTLPLVESALYLENPRVQYIHAMCLARPGGEDEIIGGSQGDDSDFTLMGDFPDSFVTLCRQESVGAVAQEFQPMKAEAGINPNYVFPLRDCEVQFQVQLVASNKTAQKDLGTLSFSQVMREAYPGAIYYYRATPFRVTRIFMRKHVVLVRPERYYTTHPNAIPTLIYPNQTEGNVYTTLRYGLLEVTECNLQINETIVGFSERRGPNQFSVAYPLDPSLGFFFDQPRFERNYFTSGVLLSHPALDGDKIDRQTLALLLFEAFLMEVPFERQDLRHGADKFRAQRAVDYASKYFVCVYDQTYGSLRLNSRLMEPRILRAVLDKAVELATNELSERLLEAEVTVEMVNALQAMADAAEQEPESLVIDDKDIPVGQRVAIIMPGSTGLYPDYRNEEFRIEAVRYTPRGVVYKGKRLSQQGPRFEEIETTVPIEKITPVNGRSTLGWFNLDTGEVEEHT